MKVSAVIPAYNEEKTIGHITRVLASIPYITEIIVVDDGSEDHTAWVAEANGAKVISLPKNIGKGGAMMVGVRNSVGEIILFLDADLIGLTTKHVMDLVEPVIMGHAEMTVGVFEHGRVATDLAQYLAPFLSGQRVVKREILEQISDLEATRFGVEMALNRYVAEHGLTVHEIILSDMSHIMKEEKLGFFKGFSARLRMYWEIAKYLSSQKHLLEDRRRNN